MGIPQFTSFLKAAKFPTNKVDYFDSILIDAQSLLYIAIDNSISEIEKDILFDVNTIVYKEIINILNSLFETKKHESTVTIVISFDGEGIPMKWPTQQKRREKLAQGRDLYKVVLFGNNLISKNVVKHLQNSLQSVRGFKNTPRHMRFLISGCDIKGEGEHKLFHIAERYKLQRPMIVSEDNDVFIISYIRFSNFKTIQIKRKRNTFYNLNDIIDYLQYSPEMLCFASLLFGNDFIPPVISISENISNLIHDILHHCTSSQLPDIFHFLLSTLVEKKKIKYTQVMFTDNQLIEEFWKNCLWILDYYKRKQFPQKYILNKLYNTFDRNMIITALLNLEYSKKSFQLAQQVYAQCVSEFQNAISHVFNKSQLQQVQRFFTNNETDQGGYIAEINIRKKMRI